jgi:antitoxin component YwqK of YwqJK toxin-antitoxin module
MYKTICYFSIFLLLSCQQKDIAPEVEAKEPTACNCDDLIMDTGFNWYYLEDRLKPFNGKCTTVSDGVTIVERSYKEGKVHGKALQWHGNGQLKLAMEFEMNRQIGEMKEWDDEGVLEYHARYSYGRMDSLIYKRQHLVTE